ncbi:hypothetical protein NQ317_006638 [Molorchus minor]|uniref:Uncharacterized protein n=1 Tax=Molorchus minor TaxID=1323400 RepID=A0ABQ9IVF0_9CUCU|nr:hypothetical protein NQ317_006638 [Molorchus minor]
MQRDINCHSDSIKNAVGGLRVLQYDGYTASPVYPTQLKEYDLVITTYSVLKAELRLTENGQPVNLRRERWQVLPTWQSINKDEMVEIMSRRSANS